MWFSSTKAINCNKSCTSLIFLSSYIVSYIYSYFFVTLKSVNAKFRFNLEHNSPNTDRLKYRFEEKKYPKKLILESFQTENGFQLKKIQIAGQTRFTLLSSLKLRTRQAIIPKTCIHHNLPFENFLIVGISRFKPNWRWHCINAPSKKNFQGPKDKKNQVNFNYLICIIVGNQQYTKSLE